MRSIHNEGQYGECLRALNGRIGSKGVVSNRKEGVRSIVYSQKKAVEGGKRTTEGEQENELNAIVRKGENESGKGRYRGARRKGDG